MSLVFVRHGESSGNVMIRNGQFDPGTPNHEYPLTEKGVEQARFAGQFLAERFARPEFYFSTALTSDLLRATMTTDIILSIMRGVGPAPNKCLADSRLNEKWDGIFHDLGDRKVKELYPDQVRMRQKNGYWLYRAPGGENCPDVELRIRSFLRDYWDDMTCRHLLIVGHGRWFLIFQKLFHSWSVGRFLEEKDKANCHNCSVFVYSSMALRKKDPPDRFLPWEGRLDYNETQFA
ncbi:MAG: histidine phosphatase family protein [Candidatus Paceibacterota bacterium]